MKSVGKDKTRRASINAESALAASMLDNRGLEYDVSKGAKEIIKKLKR